MNLQEIENRIKELGEQSVKFHLEAIKLKEILEAEKKKQKEYTWKDCFQRKGYFKSVGSTVEKANDYIVDSKNIDIATSSKVIKSHLAACQLSHIIEAINMDFKGQDNLSISLNDKKSFSISIHKWALPTLNSREAAKMLTKTNRLLLLEYFGVDDKKKVSVSEQTKLEFTKVCQLDSCKKPFLHSIHNQKFCSDKCRKLQHESKK
jgi:prolyl oligopeptidase PreP (S9A serine peptidase family)